MVVRLVTKLKNMATLTETDIFGVGLHILHLGCGISKFLLTVGRIMDFDSITCMTSHIRPHANSKYYLKLKCTCCHALSHKAQNTASDVADRFCIKEMIRQHAMCKV